MGARRKQCREGSILFSAKYDVVGVTKTIMGGAEIAAMVSLDHIMFPVLRTMQQARESASNIEHDTEFNKYPTANFMTNKQSLATYQALAFLQMAPESLQ
jgi:hypothetical protein